MLGLSFISLFGVRFSSSRIAAAILILALCWSSTSGSRAGDETAAASDKEQKEQRSKRRLEIMKSAIDDLKPSISGDASESTLEFAPTPLLRYNDETRGFLDAGVWRLGERGRPRALVTIELYRQQEGTAFLSYEFLSMTPQRLVLASPNGARWTPTPTEIKVVSLANAPEPADSAKGRLLQMRQLARRFAAHEDRQGDKVECRLLPQPIDRYDDAEQGIVDGAIFVFANGTNPEIGLLLECGKSDWSYGVLRLSSAALALDLDGKSVYQDGPFKNYTMTSPYTATRRTIALPE
ncbi:MAG TPA: hypothetical protein VKU82_02580 [Planctomycetaceae bacterium]|nr:hypothetical protein [Planctomycetaceae bacterium]